MKKKILLLSLLAGIFACFGTEASAGTATYKITQGATTLKSGDYTSFADFFNQIPKGETKPSSEGERVIATVSGASIAKGQITKKISGWLPAMFEITDDIAYTTIRFEGCTFAFDKGFGFEPVMNPGVKIECVGCEFTDKSFNGMLGTVTLPSNNFYNIDFYIDNCTIPVFAGGSSWFGDVTVVNSTCGTINLNCGMQHKAKDTRKLNSFDAQSTFTIKNSTCENSLAIYANSFANYVYEKPEAQEDQIWGYKANGYYSQVHPFKKEFIATGDKVEYLNASAEYPSFYIMLPTKVTYVANNGTDDTLVDKCAPEAKVTIKDNIFSYPGHSFVKWNSAPDGSGVDYTVGSQLQTEFAVAPMLYAIWEEASLHAIIIKCEGIKDNEVAIFSVTESGKTTPTYKVALSNGTDPSYQDVKYHNKLCKEIKIIGLNSSSSYEVSPLSWAWTYDIKLSKKTEEKTENGLVITYEYVASKKAVNTVKNAEYYKTNDVTGY